ncbi:407R [Invertebrate iridescent virus Kaz2018]|uniref:407R n=1 Tax=Invertebrate iridescent virus 6 TaxID=176652 RepID=Q91FB8_IIV6|nr:407R [Invertebrate iridescent virus 6]AAK82267.1 407R [Invertebrate iridescent virus 6]QMS79591.1 hypothetical protein IIV6-T1_400 [Invertebrate iridescent virus 6]QNH08817.1 407R [Invertebrate iridescent virus Kaz2018]
MYFHVEVLNKFKVVSFKIVKSIFDKTSSKMFFLLGLLNSNKI